METTQAVHSEDDIIARVPGRLAREVILTLVALVLAGAVGFILGIGNAPERAWGAYLVNLLFFSGLAAAGVIFGAAMQVAKGHWGKSMHRYAQAFGTFLPISYVLFLILYAGRESIFPWIGNPVNLEGHPLPSLWFNIDGLFLRGAVFLLILYFFCFVFIYFSLRPDMHVAARALTGWRRRLVNWIGRGWRGDDEEASRSRRVLARLSPPLLLGYAVIMSGMSIDLIMTLTPGWISVLFPAYFFIGAWLSALAGLAVAAAIARRGPGYDFLAANNWHDLGKLIFAFCIFWAYLWFSQFLPIWYGNIPRETIFVELRARQPWTTVSIAFFACVFVLPFLLLLWQRVKMVPPYLATVAGLILVGFWLERFDLVMPAIWSGPGVPLGWIEILVTLGFLGLFGLSYSLYASTFPLIPLREGLIVGSPRTGPY